MAIATLNDYQLQQGMRRVILSGRANVPSLPEFVKLCRTVGNDDSIADEPPRELLAPPPDDNPWLAAGATHLRSYLNTKLAENSQRYGRPASCEAMKDPKRKEDKDLDASPEFIRNVHTLVAYKNRWIDMMMDADQGRGVAVEDQREVWNECMRLAEAEIAGAA